MVDSNNVKIELELNGPINEDDELETGGTNTKSLFKNKKFLIILISVIVVVIIIVIVVIVLLSRVGSNNKKEEDEPSKEAIGEIMCQFNINEGNEDTKLLGDEFNND